MGPGLGNGGIDPAVAGSHPAAPQANRSRIARDIAGGADKEDLVVARSLELRCTARSSREAGSHTPVPGVPRRTGRTGTSPGRALVPYRRTGAPAVDDACTARRTTTTRAAAVRGAGRAKAGNDDEKSRDQKGSHLLSSKPLLLPRPRLDPEPTVANLLDRLIHRHLDWPIFSFAAGNRVWPASVHSYAAQASPSHRKHLRAARRVWRMVVLATHTPLIRVLPGPQPTASLLPSIRINLFSGRRPGSCREISSFVTSAHRSRRDGSKRRITPSSCVRPKPALPG
jgi:hypothetical protein